MVTVRSLATRLTILVLLLYPASYLLIPTHADAFNTSIVPTEQYDANRSRGAHVFDIQPGVSAARAVAVRPQASDEWVMQGLTARNLSQGSAAVSTNVTRIVVPVAGAQNSPGAAAPQAQNPVFPTWLWALGPIIVVVVLVSFLMLRTIFQDDEGHAASKIAYEGDEGIPEERYEQRGARVIPVKSSDESGDAVSARRDSTGRRATRIRIDDTEPEDRVQHDSNERLR